MNTTTISTLTFRVGHLGGARRQRERKAQMQKPDQIKKEIAFFGLVEKVTATGPGDNVRLWRNYIGPNNKWMLAIAMHFGPQHTSEKSEWNAIHVKDTLVRFKLHWGIFSHDVAALMS